LPPSGQYQTGRPEEQRPWGGIAGWCGQLRCHPRRRTKKPLPRRQGSGCSHTARREPWRVPSGPGVRRGADHPLAALATSNARNSLAGWTGFSRHADFNLLQDFWPGPLASGRLRGRLRPPPTPPRGSDLHPTVTEESDIHGGGTHVGHGRRRRAWPRNLLTPAAHAGRTSPSVG
jgi:hypothetical protein